MRPVRRHLAGPGIKLLTYYQANRTRVGVRSVKKDTQLDVA